ncbi:MAG TPA: extradiol ring-cleavage dioxygenase [Bacillales bacterium]|nr:extradiol ring-cleavage dioxygenase [Bacillales bacterium]
MELNPFVFSCIMPHGGEIVPELSGDDPSRMKKTRENAERLGQSMAETEPDAIVVVTPHGTRINGQFSIADCERMVGYEEENGTRFDMERKVERVLAAELTTEAKKAGLPAASINFGTAEGSLSNLPLDWGAVVPLRFMPDVPIVVITPSRQVSMEDHLKFGKVLRETAEASNRRIGLIASCDWCHTHDDSGPYGYDPAAGPLDEEIVQLIKDNELEKMMDFDPERVEAAKPDGIWQALVLAGAIPKEERYVEFLSYEVPTYFGLICAAYPQGK